MMEAHPDKKESLLTSFKTALEPFAEKAALKNTIVHKALRDFFQICDYTNYRTVSIFDRTCLQYDTEQPVFGVFF